MQTLVLVVVVGPTAVGKTELCLRLAEHFQTEIVSMDARQFYREMTIGTAKPTEAERASVLHHLVDSLSIQQPYDVKQFEQDALEIIAKLHEQQEVVIATGGSGLYMKTLCEGIDEMPAVDGATRQYWHERWQTEGLEKLVEHLRVVDPIFCETADLHNPRRVLRALEVHSSSGQPYSSFRNKATSEAVRPFKVIKVGLTRPRPILYERIDRRVEHMLAAGLVEEARGLYPYRQLTALHTVGYQELFPMFEEKYDLSEATRLVQRNSRRYAKRQLTWFRQDTVIRWFDLEEEGVEDVIEYVNGSMARIA